MSLLKAMKAPTLLKAAHLYHDAGVSVVPVKGKAAVVKWSDYQSRRPTKGELTTWFSRRDVTGLAIITGEVSGNLVIVDLDGRGAARAFGEKWPILRGTTIVASANGWHCYYYTDANGLPETTRLVNGPNGIKEIGLRAAGHYTVAPPSLHPSGVAYILLQDVVPRRVATLNPVARWLNELRPSRTVTPTSTVTVGKPTPTSGGKNPFYVRAVMERELSYVRYAAEGTRNDNLFHASRRLASLCANTDSGLSETTVKAALAAAAARLAADDGEQTVLRTIASGWRRGWEEPRAIPGLTNG